MLADRIEKLMNLRGVRSWRKLAELSHLSPSYLGDIKTDRTQPSVASLQAIANALNTTIGYLLGEIDSPDLTPANTTSEEKKKSTSREMFERLMERMAKKSPDLVIHFRDLDKHIDELTEEDIQGLADGYALITGMANKTIEARLKKTSRHGEL